MTLRQYEDNLVGAEPGTTMTDLGEIEGWRVRRHDASKQRAALSVFTPAHQLILGAARHFRAQNQRHRQLIEQVRSNCRCMMYFGASFTIVAGAASRRQHLSRRRRAPPFFEIDQAFGRQRHDDNPNYKTRGDMSHETGVRPSGVRPSGVRPSGVRPSGVKEVRACLPDRRLGGRHLSARTLGEQDLLFASCQS